MIIDAEGLVKTIISKGNAKLSKQRIAAAGKRFSQNLSAFNPLRKVSLVRLERACEEMGVQMVAGPHCYSFFQGNESFAKTSEDEITTFYLTDFLVRQFEAFIIKPMGLDRHPELRDMYFGNYEKLVYQAQTDDPALTEKAQDCAARLGLAFERRFTGYGDLQTALRDL